MALILTGNSSSLTVDSTSGITFPNATLQASAGVILQVVQGTYNTETTTSSSTYSDTGLTATITPKFSTSKILVIVQHAGCYKNTGNAYLGLQLLRSGSSIVVFETAAGADGGTGNNYIGTCGTCYLDSPATTSATIYKTQYRSTPNVAQVGLQYLNCTSTITLIEVAG